MTNPDWMLLLAAALAAEETSAELTSTIALVGEKDAMLVDPASGDYERVALTVDVNTANLVRTASQDWPAGTLIVPYNADIDGPAKPRVLGLLRRKVHHAGL